MAVRNKKPPCANCPQPAKVDIKLAPVAKLTNLSAAGLPTTEGHRLWKHVLFGTSTCIQMIEGYAIMEMPGDPLDALVAMRDRLNKVISKYEKPHASDPASK